MNKSKFFPLKELYPLFDSLFIIEFIRFFFILTVFYIKVGLILLNSYYFLLNSEIKGINTFIVNIEKKT